MLILRVPLQNKETGKELYMAIDKSYRINKVAAELNVGFEKLIDHLNKVGFEVERKLTSKIDGEMYTALLKEFKSDKEAKEASLAIKKQPTIVENKITVQDVVHSEPKKEGKDDVEILIKNTGVTPVSKVVEKEEKPEKIEVKQEKKEDIFVEEQQKEEKPETLNRPKVVGKIDLDKFKKPESKKKEAPKKEEKKPKQEPIDEIKEEPKEEVKEEILKPAEETPVVKPKAEKLETPKEEVIKPKMEKLAGLSIKGKITLPTVTDRRDKKKLVASSDNTDLKNKKKRKRKDGSIINSNAPNTTSGPNNKGPKFGNKPKEKTEITEKEIQDKIKKTLSKIDGNRSKSFKSKFRKKRRDDHEVTRNEQSDADDLQKSILKVTEFISASELASLMDKPVNDVITACFSLGMMVSINQRLDAETITIVADEFGFEVKFVDAEAQLTFEEIVEEDDTKLLPRAPIVTIMGHVDHGKTSLLDYIRNANVIGGEAGGITQHIGAYEVMIETGEKITFIDTPGHEAFTAMRARGAQVTDIAIIVIAADDSVMPQTREAISHAQAAAVPMIFAFNKIDKPGANTDKIREELSGMNILVEEWGGKYQTQEIYAKQGLNIDKLLEKVLLEAEILELKANPDRLANGTIVEARLDKGRGIVTTVLVQSGTMRVGDHIVAGGYYGKVKALFNERNTRVEEAGPAAPVAVLGFNGAPTAGDKFQAFETESEAKELANKRQQLIREQGIRTTKHITLDEIGRRLAVGNFKELKLIVKGDVDGSVEALSDSLLKLSTEQVAVTVIHKAVGQITESDIMLASASDAIILGFQVRPSANAKRLAEEEQIDIRHYSIIYKAIEEIKAAIEGMLEPDIVEKVIGSVQIREVFNITKVGIVAGSYVTDGKVTRSAKIRVIRDGVVIHDGQLDTLKRFKDDVKEVAKGYECGISIKGFKDIKEGDNLEVYEEEKVKKKL